MVILILPHIGLAQTSIIANHNCTDISSIPEYWITQAKSVLHIAYGHTSHGSQLTDGMTNLVGFMNGLGYPLNLYAYNNGGTGGALDLHDYAMAGDVGYYPDWVNNTRTYLNNPANADVNVIIWSWCGQVSGQTEQSMINNYLAPMTQLELDYPSVKFVYMTGHLDGSGSSGNLHIRNQQIRTYCQTNNKILYDFADIESYDPDGLVNYMELFANDNCDYDSSGFSRNWAQRWQNTHTLNVDWYNCSAAHSQPLNGNRKAYAAWWLWARLAGWSSDSGKNMKAGWNLVSVPFLQSDYTSGVVFPGKSGSMFEYNTATKQYATAPILACGKGYWVLYGSPNTVTITGSVPGPLTDTVAQAGWTLVGSYEESLPVSSLVFSNGAYKSGSVYRYDASPGQKQYVMTTEINPGEAVWINVQGATSWPCTITIP